MRNKKNHKSLISYGQGFKDGYEQGTKAAQNTWVPVDKDLPKKSDIYYVTELRDDEYETDTRYFNYYPDGGSCWSGHHTETVVAWQPMPKPYIPEG